MTSGDGNYGGTPLDLLSDPRVMPMLDTFGNIGIASGWANYIASWFPYNFNEFFDPAFALFGQDVEAIGEVYAGLESAWLEVDEIINQLNGGMQVVLNEWEGTGAVACGVYLGELETFVQNEREALLANSQIMLAYAGLIEGARKNLDNLMGGFIEACAKQAEDEEFKVGEFLINSLGAIVGAALMLVPGTQGLGVAAFATAVNGILVAGANAAGVGEVGGTTYSDIADSFIEQANRILGDMVEAITQDIAPKFRIVEHMQSPPSPPTEIGDSGKFGPESVREGGEPPSALRRTLNPPS